jgi:VWFA-related protein
MNIFRGVAGMVLVFGVALGGLVLCGPALCGAQAAKIEGAGKAEQAPGSEQVSNDQAPTIRSTTKLVLVDVVVTNHDAPVHGLGQTQFHILENGKEQPIVSFDEHRAALRPAAVAIRHAELPPHTYTNIPDYPEASAATVLLLDGLNTPVESQVQVRHQMIRYLEQIKPGTSIAIFTLSDRLKMVTGFSTDMGALTAALKGSKASPQPSALLDNSATTLQTETTVADIQSAHFVPGAPGPGTNAGVGSGSGGVMNAVAALQQFESDMASAQTDQRVRMTLDAMNQLARNLSAIPGRKNVIWFSAAFPLVIAPDPSLHLPFSGMRAYADQIRKTTELLSDARIAVYPIDARGLAMPTNVGAASATPPSSDFSGGFRQQMANSNTELEAEQGSMDLIADQTGGKAFYNTNNIPRALNEILEQGENYYTIGYVPAAKQFDNQFHSFQVKVDEKGDKLVYRSGYFADAPDKARAAGEASGLLTAAMHGAPGASEIAFDTRILPATDALFAGAHLEQGPGGEMSAGMKDAHRYVVDVVIDPHGFTFTTAADGAHKASVEIALVAFDPQGNRVNYWQHAYQMSIAADRFAKIMSSGITIRSGLDLPAGQGSLRIAVMDLTADRAGSLEVPVVVGR